MRAVLTALQLVSTCWQKPSRDSELHARYGYVSMPDLSGFLKGLNATECADFGGCGPVFARSKTGLAPGWNDTIARIAAAVRRASRALGVSREWSGESDDREASEGEESGAVGETKGEEG